LQLSASRKPTVSLCGSKSTCSSVRAGFGARQCAALETAPVRSFVRCVRLGLGAYVMRLAELVLLVNHGVHRRLNGFEEIFIGCGYLAQESNAGLTGQADADGESERGAIRGVSPSIMNTSDASTRVRSGFTQTRSIIFQSSIRASDQCAAVASESCKALDMDTMRTGGRAYCIVLQSASGHKASLPQRHPSRCTCSSFSGRDGARLWRLWGTSRS
jgi:hypothetical protein